jgi:hypothetical protein
MWERESRNTNYIGHFYKNLSFRKASYWTNLMIIMNEILAIFARALIASEFTISDLSCAFCF